MEVLFEYLEILASFPCVSTLVTSPAAFDLHSMGKMQWFPVGRNDTPGWRLDVVS
jgi:hypothetical protein